jgi:DNA polymerase
MRLHIDFETRSTVDLRVSGAYRYAEDPQTEVIMACYAIDEGPVQTWLHTQALPDDLRAALEDENCIVVAHNAGFEKAMLTYILGPRHGWPVPHPFRWDDTAARAARQALPRSLDGAASALGLDVQKDAEGRSLMLRMCRPRSVAPDGAITWWEDDARMTRLAQYCATDVEVERQLDKALRPLTDEERKVWLLTETMNDRGVSLDVPFATYAVSVAMKSQEKLNEELNQITDGAVPAATNVGKLRQWLLSKGFGILEGEDESLNKKAVENLLKSGALPDEVKRALEIRLLAGKSSVKKFQAMLDRVSKDGRVRGNLMYHGASTGRWSGAGVQLQNLPRDTVKDFDWSRKNLEASTDKALSTLSRMVRGSITAAPGHRLMWADYAAVEARGVAWLAGQADLVELFANGGKVYEEMAGVIFDMNPAEVGKDSLERFLGKTVILGCGYSMGAQKFRLSCAAMGTDIDEELAYKAVNAYRSNYAKIPRLWKMLEEAAIAAVAERGRETVYRQVAFFADKNWLLVRLPSGRKLFYHRPRLVTYAGPYGERVSLEYMAVNSMTKKWGPERTFGGKLTENIVQGLCRDLIADAMLRLEEQGYPVIASVHDEVISEVLLGEGTVDEMVRIMCELPEWAKGFPLAAEGKESVRYGK